MVSFPVLPSLNNISLSIMAHIGYNLVRYLPRDSKEWYFTTKLTPESFELDKPRKFGSAQTRNSIQLRRRSDFYRFSWRGPVTSQSAPLQGSYWRCFNSKV